MTGRRVDASPSGNRLYPAALHPPDAMALPGAGQAWEDSFLAEVFQSMASTGWLVASGLAGLVVLFIVVRSLLR